MTDWCHIKSSVHISHIYDTTKPKLKNYFKNKFTNCMEQRYLYCVIIYESYHEKPNNPLQYVGNSSNWHTHIDYICMYVGHWSERVSKLFSSLTSCPN
jgi:hypothetical protein